MSSYFVSHHCRHGHFSVKTSAQSCCGCRPQRPHSLSSRAMVVLSLIPCTSCLFLMIYLLSLLPTMTFLLPWHWGVDTSFTKFMKLWAPPVLSLLPSSSPFWKRRPLGRALCLFDPGLMDKSGMSWHELRHVFCCCCFCLFPLRPWEGNWKMGIWVSRGPFWGTCFKWHQSHMPAYGHQSGR